jgi:hypothetical protein
LLKLNTCLEQLQQAYHPIVFRHGLSLEKIRITTMCDSSLGNADKYSQGGYVHMLSNEHTDMLCGPMAMITARSCRSKRVASSTSAAETLAMVSGVESGQFLQTWLAELLHPESSASDLLNMPGASLPPHDVGTDCNDLMENLLKPAMPQPAQKSLALYLACLRETKMTESTRAWIWADTEDNIANGLTKLDPSGRIMLTEINEALRCSWWEPLKAYRWNGVLTFPGGTTVTPAILKVRPTPAVKESKEVPTTTTATANHAQARSSTMSSSSAMPTTSSSTLWNAEVPQYATSIVATVTHYDLTTTDTDNNYVEDHDLTYQWSFDDDSD